MISDKNGYPSCLDSKTTKKRKTVGNKTVKKRNTCEDEGSPGDGAVIRSGSLRFSSWFFPLVLYTKIEGKRTVCLLLTQKVVVVDTEGKKELSVFGIRLQLQLRSTK